MTTADRLGVCGGVVGVQDGWTALLQASWNGHDECVRMLRLAGATVQSASDATAGTAPYLEARCVTLVLACNRACAPVP